ncbi:hypothetical protein O0880_10480 [Janthinobacterium sp. SUN118]|uniref:hypothetical protein n=1 Tax=Janthinobacterium sp. SUN118 TaxID=3004100 RepID=UPI0025B189C7|nr:hypothetical protein [Janthinobacterium sp. SUN118]MDN2709841.1 hypothetical protein [Janthinobacterium sp. SUN118]
MTAEIKPIGKLRFDALASYCRSPETALFSDEIEWHQTLEENILIVVIKDRTDSDFLAILLCRDLKERYRFIHMTAFYESAAETLENVSKKIDQVLADFENVRHQGDEKGAPVDFFSPVVSDARLNSDFKTMTTLAGFSPALEIMKPMMRWYEDPDGNFIQQFQTDDFNTRFWEIYLFCNVVRGSVRSAATTSSSRLFRKWPIR